jgi:two-component system KDP operon response regulator KdpE
MRATLLAEGYRDNALDAGADDFLTSPSASESFWRGCEWPCVMRHGSARVSAPSSRPANCASTWPGGPSHAHGIQAPHRARAQRGKVLTHRHLLVEVWGPESAEQSQYLRVYMGQLRHKPEKDSARPRYIVTEVGVGYRLQAE